MQNTGGYKITYTHAREKNNNKKTAEIKKKKKELKTHPKRQTDRGAKERNQIKTRITTTTTKVLIKKGEEVEIFLVSYK